MHDPIASIFASLTASAALTALLDTREGAPAVFSGGVLPLDYDVSAVPCVIIGPIEDQRDADTFSGFARFADIRVRLFALAAESSLALDEAAETVRAVLHRQTLSASGGLTPFSRVISGPRETATSGPEVTGRGLTVRLYIKG